MHAAGAHLNPKGTRRMFSKTRLEAQCTEEAPSGVFRVAGQAPGADELASRGIDGLWIAFQPVVSSRDEHVFGYEAQFRVVEETRPAMVERAAERAGRLVELGRAIRASTVRALRAAPSECLIFLRVLPIDLLDGELYSLDSPLSGVAHRVVLELTERASLDGRWSMRERVYDLRQLGYRVALDRFASGYPQLDALTSLQPEFVRLDASLVRALTRDPAARQTVSALVSLCRDIDAAPLAQGVEKSGERDALSALGCDLMQGALFAPAGAGFPALPKRFAAPL
jgi:EAL domain-containing protein (putative c-di-GMP-specific phosphodiesterase class I)